MANSFIYMGVTFTPSRKLPDVVSFLAEQVRNKRVVSDYTTKDGYSWDEFFAAARSAGCGNFDTFHMEGAGDIEFLPCGGNLFRIENK